MKQRCGLPGGCPGSGCDLKYELELDGDPERKALHAINEPAGIAIFAEDILQELRGSIGHSRLILWSFAGCDHHSEPNDSRDSVQRAEMLLRDGEGIQRSQPAGPIAGLDIELCSDPAGELSASSFGGEHSSQEKKVSGPNGFRIDAEGLRRPRQSQAQLLQTGFHPSSRRDHPGFRLSRAAAAHINLTRKCAELSCPRLLRDESRAGRVCR